MKKTVLKILLIATFGLCMTTLLDAQQLKFYDNVSKLPLTGVNIFDKSHQPVNATMVNQLNENTIYTAELPDYSPVRFTMASIMKSEGMLYLSKLRQDLKEVVVTAAKRPQNQEDVPYLVSVLDNKEISRINQVTTARLLANSGKAYVQTSQMGGGSPTLRGFEANRVLYVVDGIKLNNAIYRAGHLQDIITVDVNQLDKMEVLYGPSSLLYGSDAVGGVIQMITKSPSLRTDDAMHAFSGEIGGRYSSAYGEKNGRINLQYSGKKFANLTAFTYSDFGDLISGKSKNFFDSTLWLRPQYVAVINGKDSIVNNSDPYKAVSSGYSQYDILNKSIIQLSDEVRLNLNVQYSRSSNIPRYDRLTQIKNGKLRYAEWNYGPQIRLLVTPTLVYSPANNKLFDNLNIQPYFQKSKQERINRALNSTKRLTQTEDVTIAGLNVDINKEYAGGLTHYAGVEYILNDVKSTAVALNISNNTTSPEGTRYPPGTNTMQDVGIYSKWTYKLNRMTLDGGLRYQHRSLSSNVGDDTFYPVYIPDFSQSNGTLSGNLGISYAVTPHNHLKAALSRGYRAANLDDLGKIFDSSPGKVIVPTGNVKPETANSAEISWVHRGPKFQFYITPFFTFLKDAIVTTPGTYNGKDSIIYQDVLSRVELITNAAEAKVYGVQAGFDLAITSNWALNYNMTYTKGRYTPIADNKEVPMDHIPPIFGKLGIAYENQNLFAGFDVVFNGKKKLEDYSPTGEDNLSSATPNGMPAWIIGNLYAGYNWKSLGISVGVDNILDTHYRTFASGINAPGRNFKVSLGYKF